MLLNHANILTVLIFLSTTLYLSPTFSMKLGASDEAQARTRTPSLKLAPAEEGKASNTVQILFPVQVAQILTHLAKSFARQEDVPVELDPTAFSPRRTSVAITKEFQGYNKTKESMELARAQLCELLQRNYFGPELDLVQANYVANPEALIVLDFLRTNRSVHKLNLHKAQFRPQDYFVLAALIAGNRFLTHLNLTAANFYLDSLRILAAALNSNNTLETLVLRPCEITNSPDPARDFTLQEVTEFYDMIKNNVGLCFIGWSYTLHGSGLIETLAEQGNPVAAMHAGTYQKEKKDYVKARQFFELAREKGHPLANYELASIKELEEDIPGAVNLLLISAKKGLAKAALKLGNYYRKIWPESDHPLQNYNDKEAYSWYLRAAKVEISDVIFVGDGEIYGEALYYLASMHKEGQAVRCSPKIAVKLFREAAEQGFPKAFLALSEMFLAQLRANRDYPALVQPNQDLLKISETQAVAYLLAAHKFKETFPAAKKHLDSLQKEHPDILERFFRRPVTQ